MLHTKFQGHRPFGFLRRFLKAFTVYGRGGHLGQVIKKKVGEKSRECHNHKPQPFPDTKRKRKPTNPNKQKIEQRYKKH